MRRALDTYREVVLDAAIALGAFALTTAIMVLPEEQVSDRDADALGILLVAASTLPLVAWRRAVLAVLVVTALATSLMTGLGYPDGPPIGPFIALFLVGLSGARVRGSAPLTFGLIVATLTVHLAAQGIDNEQFPAAEVFLGGPFWLAVWIGGDRLRLRHERMAELEEKAQREQELAVAEERTRIARDLHDSAGHAISVILVHAGAARLLRDKNPERAARALETIEEVARETLGEIDQLVQALRDSDGAVIEPPAGLAALDALVQRHRDAGLDVALLVTGKQRPLGAAVDRAAFRILQESLTNALRHGDGAANVTLDYGNDAVAIAVTNPAAGNGANAAGHGIVGMRERASLVGGSLQTARANGVFSVSARLPYAGEEAR